MTQAEKVEKFLNEHGSLDRYQAMIHLRIANITAVISDMKMHGYDIVTDTAVSSEGVEHAVYRWGQRCQTES